MAVSVDTKSAPAFRLFRQGHPVEVVDNAARIAWLHMDDGSVCGVDRAALWNHSAGAPDPVRVVFGAARDEVTRELQRWRCSVDRSAPVA